MKLLEEIKIERFKWTFNLFSVEYYTFNEVQVQLYNYSKFSEYNVKRVDEVFFTAFRMTF